MNRYTLMVKEREEGSMPWPFNTRARNIGLAKQKVWDYDFNLIILGTIKTNKRGEYYDD